MDLIQNGTNKETLSQPPAISIFMLFQRIYCRRIWIVQENLFEADTLCEALDEHSEMKKGPIYRHEQRPFGRLPKDRSPKRIKTAQVSEL
jgi:hypothetical protein